jgi:2-hydroxychromene-2-carboxylate isomerase
MKTLDFYYFLGSTYTHLSVHRAAALCERAGVDLVWRPFSVRALMREQNNSPFAGKPLKMAYMWRDIQRRAERFGLPSYTALPPYPIDPHLQANHVAALAALEGWCPAFTRAAYHCWFVQARDPGDPAHLQAILESLGHDAAAVLARAAAEPVRARYEQHTTTARELGLFGSPSFVCGREIFWGDDRLEDAIDWCLSH